MRRIRLKLSLAILLIIVRREGFAQTAEFECTRALNLLVDSVLSTEADSVIYMRNRDHMRLWFELTVDSRGSLLFCRIMRSDGVHEELKVVVDSLCDAMMRHRFQCMYDVYGTFESQVVIMVPFVPLRLESRD